MKPFKVERDEDKKMKIINKSMDLEDLKTTEALAIIEELKVLIEQYEKEGCKISSWYGDCDGNPYMIKLNI